MLTSSDKKILLSIIFNISLLSIGHALSQKIIILAALIHFVFIVIKSPRESFFQIMLFYLPWSPVMKFTPDTFTWFTFIVPIFYVYICLFKTEKYENIKYSKESILITLSILVLTLFIKLINSYKISFSYIMFIFMFMFIPTYFNNYGKKIYFTSSAIFLSFGIISTCIASKILINYSHMISYIEVDEFKNLSLVRLSGFYGDPNFYSSHILVAILCLFIILIKDKSKNKMLLCINIIILLYFGMESVSKMFLLVIVASLIVWTIGLLVMRENKKVKIGIIIMTVLSFLVIHKLGIFEEQIAMYISRFSNVSNFNQLTTGRSNLFFKYIEFFKEDIFVTILGQGYSEVLPKGMTHRAHNSLIQSIYQFGIFGTSILFIWLFKLSKCIKYKKLEIKSRSITKLCMIISLFIACFLPWASLDILFFDEFFYITSLFLIGRRYILNYEEVNID